MVVVYRSLGYTTTTIIIIIFNIYMESSGYEDST
jgi:hypothetical protein